VAFILEELRQSCADRATAIASSLLGTGLVFVGLLVGFFRCVSLCNALGIEKRRAGGPRKPFSGATLARRCVAYLSTAPAFGNAIRFDSRATSSSTARAFIWGARWAYRIVILRSECPSNSRTVLRSTPAITKRLAK